MWRFTGVLHNIRRSRLIGWRLVRRSLYTCENSSREEVVSAIKVNTEIVTEHLTPTIKLHLISPKCALWSSTEEDSPFIDPFWAFYWPGGQVLTRYILDNRHLFQGRRIVDVGSGCGASAIACAMSGAKQIIANDICEIALTAAELNASLNNVTIETYRENLIGKSDENWNTVLLGDMFYNEEFASDVIDWLVDLHNQKKSIFIGDPGRIYLMNHPIRHKLRKLAEYELSPQCKSENNGMVTGSVWCFS